MKITAITVCVNFSDFLAETIPFNSKLLDEWIVVTSSTDQKTIELCKTNQIKTVISDRYMLGKFNKAAMINDGLDAVELKDEWVLFLDADIILPSDLIERLSVETLDKTCIYGSNRIHCINKTQMNDYLKTKNASEVRVSNHPAIGFFQLFHSSTKLKTNECFKTAGGYDDEFRKRFSCVKNLQLNVIHLGYDGMHWSGRIDISFDSAVQNKNDILQKNKGSKEIKENLSLVDRKKLEQELSLQPTFSGEWNVKEDNLILTHIAGSQGLDNQFNVLDVPSIVIGFDYAVNGKIFSGVQPIYMTKEGHNILGSPIGKINAKICKVTAKEGYAVGGIQVNNENVITAMQVVFFRIEGNRLNPNDSYKSDWIIKVAEIPETPKLLGGTGEFVVGTYGWGGSDCDCLGLVLKKY